MDKKWANTYVCLFLLMWFFTIYLWTRLDDRDRELLRLTLRMSSKDAHIVELTANIALLEQQVEEKEHTVAMLREALQEHKDFALEVTATPGPIGMAEMFQAPQGEQAMEINIQRPLHRQYGDFFNMLSPEYADAAREILGDYMMHVARLRRGHLGGDRESLVVSAELARETMLAELRENIGDEGLALYEQYERELPGRNIDQEMKTQLGRFAHKLSPETMEMVRHTVVEELLLAQPKEIIILPDPEALQEIMVMHQNAYERALERLTPHLAADEHESVHHFIQLQKQTAPRW